MADITDITDITKMAAITVVGLEGAELVEVGAELAGEVGFVADDAVHGLWGGDEGQGGCSGCSGCRGGRVGALGGLLRLVAAPDAGHRVVAPTGVVIEGLEDGRRVFGDGGAQDLDGAANEAGGPGQVLRERQLRRDTRDGEVIERGSGGLRIDQAKEGEGVIGGKEVLVWQLPKEREELDVRADEVKLGGELLGWEIAHGVLGEEPCLVCCGGDVGRVWWPRRGGELVADDALEAPEGEGDALGEERFEVALGIEAGDDAAAVGVPRCFVLDAGDDGE
jgi:hypothetical protein